MLRRRRCGNFSRPSGSFRPPQQQMPAYPTPKQFTQKTLQRRSRSFVVGPTLEIALPFGLSAEVDALYRPLNLKTQQRTQLPNVVFSNLVLDGPVLSTRI